MVILEKYSFYCFIKPYLANVLISNLLKITGNLAFSGVFRGYEMQILTINRLITSGQYIAWKLSVFGVFLVRLFPHSD